MYSNNKITDETKRLIELEMAEIIAGDEIKITRLERDVFLALLASKLSDDSIRKITTAGIFTFSSALIGACKEESNKRNGKFTVKIKTINGKKPDSGRSMYGEIMAMLNLD